MVTILLKTSTAKPQANIIDVTVHGNTIFRIELANKLNCIIGNHANYNR
jgi:hypothetical protein